MSPDELFLMLRYVCICAVAGYISSKCYREAMGEVQRPSLASGFAWAAVQAVIALLIGTLSPVPFGIGTWYHPNYSEHSGLSFNMDWISVVAVFLGWTVAGWMGWVDGCLKRRDPMDGL